MMLFEYIILSCIIFIVSVLYIYIYNIVYNLNIYMRDV